MHGKRIFCNVRRGNRIVVIDLINEDFDQIILESEKPDELVNIIHNAVAASSNT
jgi:hypothetical protein